MSARPSILFINQFYWPDHHAAGQHLADLAEHLADSGHDVTVLCGRSPRRKGEAIVSPREVRRGVQIVRVPTFSSESGSLGWRMIGYAFFYAQVFLRLMVGRRYDLVVPLTTPPLLASAVALASIPRQFDYAVWSMDLHPDAEFSLGMLRPDSAIGRILAGIDRWSGCRAQFVVALGMCMKRRMVDRGLESERIHVIQPWSHSEDVAPLGSAPNPLRSSLGLEGKFVVMYSGNAGLAHRFDEVLEAMQVLKNVDDIRFLFVGGGPRRAEVETFIDRHSLSNARYIDYLPREELRYSLPLGDVHLITLRKEMVGVAVPSKLFGIMAAGKPALMVGPQACEVGEIILRERIGDVIPPGGAESGHRLAAAILHLYSDLQRARSFGERARRAFTERYDYTFACDRWTDLIAAYGGSGVGAVDPAHGRRPSLSRVPQEASHV